METEYANALNQYPTIFISFAGAKGELISIVETIKYEFRREYDPLSFVFNESLTEFEIDECNKIKKALLNTDDGTKTSVPMTKADMARYGGTGSPSYGPQNKFKLYTVADYEMGQLHGSSFVQYLGNNNSTRQYNYIGVTLPSQFTMTSNNLSHSSSYHYRQDKENNAVVWAVAMNPSPSVAPLKSIALYSKGKSSSITYFNSKTKIQYFLFFILM